MSYWSGEAILSQHPAVRHVYSQFTDSLAQSELDAMGPADFDWADRCRTTLDTLLPELPSLAQRIKTEVPLELNSAVDLAELISDGENILADFIAQEPRADEWYTQTSKTARLAQSVNQHLESQQISSAIQRYVLSVPGLGRLVYGNGNSIYPDLICRCHSYTGLPRQSRKNPVDGASLQGVQNPRPSNVPDGCELKTNRGDRIRVDAHGAHPGLHLGVTWTLEGDRVEINGVWVAWVRLADHRESGRNVKVTTVKYSFGHDLFSRLA